MTEPTIQELLERIIELERSVERLESDLRDEARSREAADYSLSEGRGLPYQ